MSINAIRDDVRKAPETLAHLHYWSVQLTRRAGQDEVRGALGETRQVAG